MDPKQLSIAILVPAIVAGVVLTIGWKLFSSAARRDSAAPAPAAAIAISLGAAAGFLCINGWRPLPVEAYLWMLWVFPAAALLGGIESRAGTPFLAATLLRVALIALAATLVLRKAIFQQDGAVNYNLLVSCIGFPLIAISLWRSVLPFLSAATAASALWMVCVGTSALLLFANSLKLAQTGAALAGALGALVVACLMRPSIGGAMGAIAPVAVILSMLEFLSIEYSSAEFSPSLFAVVAVAPAMGCLPIARSSWAKLGWIAIPIAIAVALAFRTYDTSAF